MEYKKKLVLEKYSIKIKMWVFDPPKKRKRKMVFHNKMFLWLRKNVPQRTKKRRFRFTMRGTIIILV